MTRPPNFRQRRQGFTLVELLVVLAVIAILAALLLPALASAKADGKRAACISNLRQIGVAIRAYSMDYGGLIPYGPQPPPIINVADFYTSIGAPTSLVSLSGGAMVGLGLMLSNELAREPKVLFCPASDQDLNAETELKEVGLAQAECGYFYRHAGNTNLVQTTAGSFNPTHIKLDDLGKNSSNQPIEALVMDTQLLCPPELAPFGVVNSTHHQQRYANILFADGHAATRANGNGQFDVNLTLPTLQRSFSLILAVFETADAQP